MRSRSEAWVSARPPSRPSAEDDQLAARRSGHGSRSNSRVDRVGERDDRRFGEVAIALGDVERVAVRGDQLHAEREAALVDHPPHAVERDRRTARRAIAAGEARRPASAASGGGAKRDCVDQPVEQRRPPRRAGRPAPARGLRICAEMLGQLRPRLEQAVEIDPARQPLDDVAEAVERAHRVGARGDRAHQRRQHRLERRARRRRAQRPRPARAPVGDPAQRLVDGRRSPSRPVRARRMSGSFDSRSLALGDQPVELRADRLDMRRAARSSSAAPSSQPVEPGDLRRAPPASAGRRWVCRSSIICTRCSTVRSAR